jgi:hypothetical protein
MSQCYRALPTGVEGGDESGSGLDYDELMQVMIVVFFV